MSDHEPADYPMRPAPTSAPAAPGREHRRVEQEFTAFYCSTVKPLVGFLVNLGAPLPVAADIAQDTMLTAYRTWSAIRQPRAWAHSVASRALIRAIAEVREEPVDEVPEPTSLLPRPDAFAEWQARYDLLPLLRALPHRQRQVLAWSLSGFTPAETAEQLEIRPEAVRASLRKARLAIAQQLDIREEEQ
ncbi:sigma-70 family RNA polymerase sigma factor [Streptomyces sp. NPDC026673]|uniref:RNA polymerase sigma factor n=1 Tax=Streptomyces sp. NPDC026673 TaxID=3155724 RepID=UPI0033FF0738